MQNLSRWVGCAPIFPNMALPVETARLTPEEYLRIEREALDKSEYRDGEMVAMAGASYAHNVLVANVVASLHAQLRGKNCTPIPCGLLGADGSNSRTQVTFPSPASALAPPQRGSRVSNELRLSEVWACRSA